MTPKYRKLSNAIEGIKHWSWFSWSKNKFKKKAGNALRRASRRELKRHGRELIDEALEEQEKGAD